MLSLEEAKNRIEGILTESMEGKVHAELEQYLSDFRNDYEEYYNSEGVHSADEENYKEKYETLKSRYIERFMGTGDGEAIKKNVSETKEDGAGEVVEEESAITINDLFEERR